MIANKIIINLAVSLNYILHCSHHFLCATIYNLLYTTIIALWLFFLAYNGDIQPKTVLFTRHAPSHKADWILPTSCLLCLLFLYVNSLMNILEVECSCSKFFENSIATSLLFVYFIYIACCCVHLLVYPLFFHTDVVGFLVTNSLYLFV